MKIAYFDETRKVPEQAEAVVKEIVERAGERLELTDNTEVSVVLVDDEKIHTLNRDYRHKDQVTDVISFALEDDANDQALFDIPELAEELPRLLGDIYISVPQTARQAVTYDQPFIKELASLAVHGLLHLNGYDHQTDEEAQEMFDLQTEIVEGYSFDETITPQN